MGFNKKFYIFNNICRLLSFLITLATYASKAFRQSFSNALNLRAESLSKGCKSTVRRQLKTLASSSREEQSCLHSGHTAPPISRLRYILSKVRLPHHAAFVEGKTEPRRLHAFKQEFYQNCLGSRVFFLQRFESLQRKQQKLRLRLIFLSRIGQAARRRSPRSNM